MPLIADWLQNMENRQLLIDFFKVNVFLFFIPGINSWFVIPVTFNYLLFFLYVNINVY